MAQREKSRRMRGIEFNLLGPLNKEAMRLEAEGTPVLYLNLGNPAHFGISAPDYILETMRSEIDSTQPYCPAEGLLSARKAIARYAMTQGVPGVYPKDIYIGNGVSELIEIAMLALLNPGDEVLIPAPDYPLWMGAIQLAEGKPVHYLCDEQADWMPSMEDMRRKVTAKTRAIVLVNPNNPTGAVYPRELVQQVVELAKEKGLMIFSDEIYDRLVMDGIAHTPTAAVAGADVFTVTFSGLSKSHCLCGWRVAWMVMSGPAAEYSGFLEGVDMLASMRICANVPAQTVIPHALEDKTSFLPLLQPGGRYYEQRRAVVEEIDKIDGLSCVPSRHSFYVFPKIDLEKFRLENDMEFCMEVLKKKHIMLSDGSGFHWPGADHFRIVYLPEEARLRKAVRDIGDYLNTVRK